MENVQELIEQLVVEDYKMSGRVWDAIIPASDRYYRNRSFEDLLERNQHALMDDSMTEKERQDLSNAIEFELREKFARYEKCQAVIRSVCAGLDPHDKINKSDLADLFTWGPMAEHEALEKLLYKDFSKIDEVGGPEAYLREEFSKQFLAELRDAHDYGAQKASLFKTILSICADTEFHDWHWLLDMIRVGEVAILADAELLFSVDGGIVLSGSGYSHPVLPNYEDSYSSLSSSRSGGMSTSQIVKVWPERRIARTLSRFYLLPNSFGASERAHEVLARIDNEDIYDQLRAFELSEDGPDAFLNEDKGEYREFSKTLEERYRKIIQESAKFGSIMGEDVSVVH